MRWPTTLLTLLLTTAPQQDRENRLMDEIERTVALPTGAGPLSAYGRYYAYEGRGKVLAIYLVPEPSVGNSCEIFTIHRGSRPCNRREIQEMKRRHARAAGLRVPAGKRRWYGDSRDLPQIADGGCMQITIEYDVASKRVLGVACNGIA